MKSIGKTVYNGGIIPKYYRIAYFNFASHSAQAYPYGIHWFVMLRRRLWEWSMRYQSSKFEQAIHRAYKEGYRDGQARMEIDRYMSVARYVNLH